MDILRESMSTGRLLEDEDDDELEDDEEELEDDELEDDEGGVEGLMEHTALVKREQFCAKKWNMDGHDSRQALHTVSFLPPSKQQGVWMYSPVCTWSAQGKITGAAVELLPLITALPTALSGLHTTGLQRVQFVQMASALDVQGVDSYTPVSSEARHLVHGEHSLSEKSVHGLLSHEPGAHWSEHLRQTLSMVSREMFPREHACRSTKCESGHEFIPMQLSHLETSDLSSPLHVLFMYFPLGQTRAHGEHEESSSTVHCEEMYLCGPHVSLHAEHCAKESTAQSLLTKDLPGTQLFGHSVQLMESRVVSPVQGSPVAIRLGGQSLCAVHLWHPRSLLLPIPGHTGWGASVRK
jgi:hypothetical protein